MYSPCAVAGSSALLMRSQAALVGQVDLHLLGGQRLVAVDGDGHRGAVARGQDVLLDRRRMDGVAVGQQHALGEVLARAPQRVGVVPLLGLGVEDGLDGQAVAVLQGSGISSSTRSAAKPVTTTARSSPTAAKFASTTSRIVRSPSTGSSVLGSASVSGRSRSPLPAASTMPDHCFVLQVVHDDVRRGRTRSSRPRPRPRRPPPAAAASAKNTPRGAPASSSAAATISRPSQPPLTRPTQRGGSAPRRRRR